MPTQSSDTSQIAPDRPGGRGHRVVAREDGRKIWLPGARAPIPLRDARVVWEGAVCAQTDPELFFPEKGQSAAPAKAVCATCPVQRLCLKVFGPVMGHGVVGGLTDTQRRHLRFRSASAA